MLDNLVKLDQYDKIGKLSKSIHDLYGIVKAWLGDVMAIEQNSVQMVGLSKDELLSMPEPIREKLKIAFDIEGNESEQVVLVFTLDSKYINQKLISGGIKYSQFHKVIEVASNLVTSWNKYSEDNIKELTNSFLKDEAREKFEKLVELDNAKLRANYLKDVEFFTSAQIHELSHQEESTNPHQLASIWKSEGRIFSIKHENKELFPVFQFKDGKPLPVIKKILEALPNNITSWQTAFWFWAGNGWLDGETPENSLMDEQSVIFAAEQEKKAVIN